MKKIFIGALLLNLIITTTNYAVRTRPLKITFWNNNGRLNTSDKDDGAIRELIISRKKISPGSKKDLNTYRYIRIGKRHNFSVGTDSRKKQGQYVESVKIKI